MVTAACFTNLNISLFCCCCCCFSLGHRYSVHIYYSFKNFKIQQDSTTLKSECQNWLEEKGRVLCGGKIQDLQSNQTSCLLLEVKHHGFLMQGVCFICHVWNAFLLVLFFGDFFFPDTVLLVLLWVLTKKRLMNIKGTNFTANHPQYTCYIQFLLAYLYIFFSSDLE